MDANEVLSVGILVVNDGLACHNIVAEMLRRHHCQVLHTGGVFDVLNAIWEIKDRLHLVLTNACKLEPNGNEICGHIERKLGIPVRCMCNDKRKIESKGQQFSFSAYVLNGLSRNNLNELGQFALEKEKNHEIVAATQGEKVQRASISNVAVETNKGSSSISDAARLNQRCKGVELNEGSKEDHATVKKPRVVWSPEMHQRFLEAIDTLGYEKAVPKKIVEVMNIPGLTRENVASHLQKYRGCMKRSQEPGLNSFSSRSTRREYEGLGVLSSPATSRLNSLQTNVTTSPQSSYMSTTKESVSPSMSRYLNTCKDFSFDTTSERRNYRSTGGLLFSDRSGVDQLQEKHVPKLQLTPTFRIYGDQTRNMLLSIEKSSSTDNSNQSNMSKFVGYRVTSDGKSIEYGYIENSIGTINTEAVVSTPGTYGDQSTSYKHNPILDQNPLLSTRCISRQPVLLESHTHETSFPCQSIPGICANENPTQSTTTSVVNSSRELALLSLHSQNIEDFLNLDPSTPPSSTSRQYISVQPFRDSGHEEDTEKWFSILDQETSAQSRETNANVPPFQNPSENDIAVHNASTPSSMFPCDQDFSIPPLETAADDFPVQSPTAFFNSISQQQHSPSPLPQMLQYFDEFLDQRQNDDALLIETGSTSHQFDLEEFDDNLFSQDD